MALKEDRVGELYAGTWKSQQTPTTTGVRRWSAVVVGGSRHIWLGIETDRRFILVPLIFWQ